MFARSATMATLLGFSLACSGAGDAGLTGTLTGLEAGDVACYVNLKPASGDELYLHGDFALCEDTSLVGKEVVLTTEKANVMGDSCEGDPECTDTKEVDLVMKITAK